MRRIASFAVRIRALSLLLPLLAVPAGLGAQGDPAPAPEVEELPTAPAPLAVTTEEGDPEEGAELAELRRLLAEAEAIFNSARQPDAAPLLTALVDRLAPGGPTAAATPSGEVLRRALLLRAETSFNLGEEAAARADLAALLAFDPGARLDAAAVSPKFFALLESLRAEMVGDLVLAVSPADATVTLGERVLEAWQGAAPVLAGRYQVTVQRPGYRSLTTELVVPAADGVLLEADLERTSAVVRLTTRPGGVEVRVDGRAAGVTAEDAELLIDGLAVGSHEIELARAGYRTRRVQLEIDALADHELEPLELEPTRGTLTIRGVPAGATVRVAGEVRDADSVAAGLELPPGEIEVEVVLPRVGSFVDRIELADARAVSVEAALRPTLAVLGAAGEGPAEARERLRRALAELPGWRPLDARELAESIFRRLGARIADLPGIASGQVPVSWRDLQAALDEEIGASLYLAATGGGGEPGGEIWLFSPAPAPPAPTRWPAGDGGSARLLAALGEPLRLTAPRLGARLADSDASGGPVVISVDPEGPAAAAGIAVGDRITHVGDTEVQRREEVLALLATRPPGDRFDLGVTRGGTAERREVAWRPGPVMRWPAETGAEAPIRRALARLALATRGGEAPAWLLELDEAARLLGRQQWLQAADLLRTVQAPERRGLGRGTVDYWLGVALAAGDPSSPAARSAFERAAAAGDATLGSDDGPPVAPRARARLDG